MDLEKGESILDNSIIRIEKEIDLTDAPTIFDDIVVSRTLTDVNHFLLD